MMLLLLLPQGKMSNYATDLFGPIFDEIQRVTGARTYTDKVRQQRCCATIRWRCHAQYSWFASRLLLLQHAAFCASSRSALAS